MGQGGEGMPEQDSEDQTRRRTGRQGEGLGDWTGGCTHRSPSEARAEELPLRWGKQGAGSACINNPGNRAGKIFLWGGVLFFSGIIVFFAGRNYLSMARHNLLAQSLDPLPKNPTLFGYFEGSDVKFDNSGEDFARIFSEVMMGEYGVPLSLREAGISMLLMPTGVVIEDDTVKLTYHYAESGGLAVLAVSLTDGACTCEMLHITGGGSGPTDVSWDNITNKPEGIEPAIVVLSGSPEEEASYTEDIISQISAAVESNSRLVLEWGSEQFSVDYAERSSRPVLSFRRDLVSYEVTLDTSANTASVQNISALTSSNLRDTVGDSQTDVMTQKAVTDLVKSLGLSVVEVGGDPSLAETWTADVISTVNTMVLGGCRSLLIAAPEEFGSYLSTKLYAYDFSEKHYVEIDYVNEDVKYAVVLNATDSTAEVSALALGGLSKIDLDVSPSDAAAYTATVRQALRKAAQAGDAIVLRNGGIDVVVQTARYDEGKVTFVFSGEDIGHTMVFVPADDITAATVVSAAVMPQSVMTLSGDIAETTSWADAKTALRQAVLGGSQPVAMYDGTMWVASAFYGQQEGNVTATFMDSFDRTVEVVVTNEGVVTCNAPAILNETYISQETGAATNKIMSQDAVTKKLINTLTLTGDVTGTGTPADGNLSVATTIHGAAKTVTLTGAVTGTGTAEDGTATVDTTLSGSAN